MSSFAAVADVPHHFVSLIEWDSDWSRREARYELVDGHPIMTPSESFDTVRAAWHLGHLIESATRGRLLATPTFDVLLRKDPPLIRVPDLVIVSREQTPSGNRATADAVSLVVEVLSPTTRATDLGRKRHDYGGASIPAYLLLELHPSRPTFTLLTDPVDGDYRVESAGDSVLLHIAGHEIPVHADDVFR